MKAFIVEVTVPDDWTKADIASASNTGVRVWAESQRRPITALEYNSMVLTELKLDKPTL